MIATQRDPRFTMGMTADWRGQKYELVGVKPHRRRDGRETLVLVWRTGCLTCGASFETATPQRTLKYPTRRCPLHRNQNQTTTTA
jgi:hypothetical protein